jgi:hypothetical protein
MRLARLAAAATLALALLAAPLVAEAQQPRDMTRIGLLTFYGPSPYDDVFRKRLRELGWIEGRNITIEYRTAEEKLERVAVLARNWSA